MKKADAGFTLVELMIVFVVIGALFAIGVPGLVAVSKNNDIVASTNDLVIALGLARGEAIKRNGRVVACSSSGAASGAFGCTTGTGWQVGWMVYVDTNANGAYDVGEQVLLTHSRLSNNMTMIGNNNVANFVSYNGQGIVPGGFGAWIVADDRGGVNGTRLVCMAVTGRTRVLADGSTTCPGTGNG